MEANTKGSCYRVPSEIFWTSRYMLWTVESSGGRAIHRSCGEKTLGLSMFRRSGSIACISVRDNGRC